MNARSRCGLVLIGLFALFGASIGSFADAGSGPDDAKKRLEDGKELFTREWLPDDKRSFAGNGLGPVFNARSCVACHRQGEIGGAGPKGSNATIVSVFVDLSLPHFISGIPVAAPDPKSPVKQPDRGKLGEIHPALRTESSFPVHRFSMAKEFEKWKAEHFPHGFNGFNGGSEMRVDDVKIAIIASERNTPALFGAGLIDRTRESVLETVAAEQAAKSRNLVAILNHFMNTEQVGRRREPLPISGRVAHLKEGKVGRFGWKANVATLRDFTLQACSNELGLEVPGFSRAAPPWVKDYKAPGLDLSADQCDRLIEFVASLPRPVVRAPETPEHATEIAAGQKLFGSMGCAVCHREKLGDVDGIYSDMLLHDMGQSLSGSGFYGTNISNVEFVKTKDATEPIPVNRDAPDKTTREKPPTFGAGAREWRTPPLWGLRDSAPYLHDGRAETIADAIELHDGEGATAAQAFDKLTPQERRQLDMFLRTLAAPPARSNWTR